MKKRILTLALILAVMVVSLSGCGTSKDESVVVASKQFTESIVLGELYAQLIEAKTDLKVDRKLNLGGTSVIMPAMESGDVDIYFEYTGTACSEILKLDTSGGMTAESALEDTINGMDSKHGIKFFTPVGLNNTYCLAMPRELADELGVKTISDLQKHDQDLVFGSAHTFYARVSDGYDALLETYDLEFKDAEMMDKTLMYEASATGDLDVVVAFSTDAMLLEYDLVILEDDKALFPPYHGAPMCRKETLKAHPELEEVLDTFAGIIDDVTMQELNYKVDVEKKTPEEVAREFLKEKGII